jgi:hypothetical protein
LFGVGLAESKLCAFGFGGFRFLISQSADCNSIKELASGSAIQIKLPASETAGFKFSLPAQSLFDCGFAAERFSAPASESFPKFGRAICASIFQVRLVYSWLVKETSQVVQL